MFYSHFDYFQQPPLRDTPNTKLGDHDTMKSHNHRYIMFFIMCEGRPFPRIDIAFGRGFGHI